MTPIWAGLTPFCRNLVTMRSTLVASVRLRKEVPAVSQVHWCRCISAHQYISTCRYVLHHHAMHEPVYMSLAGQQRLMPQQVHVGANALRRSTFARVF
jgi:hypothetical protein